MPVLLLERLPLPSLEAYAVVSVSLLGWSLHYAAEKTLNPSWRMQFVDTKNVSQELPGTLQTYISNILSRYWFSSRAQDIISFSIHDSLCIWVSTLFSLLICNYLIFLFYTDCCQHGLLPSCPFWKLAPKTSIWGT